MPIDPVIHPLASGYGSGLDLKVDYTTFTTPEVSLVIEASGETGGATAMASYDMTWNEFSKVVDKLVELRDRIKVETTPVENTTLAKMSKKGRKS